MNEDRSAYPIPLILDSEETTSSLRSSPRVHGCLIFVCSCGELSEFLTFFDLDDVGGS